VVHLGKLRESSRGINAACILRHCYLEGINPKSSFQFVETDGID
jgi:hypothetical protein